MNLDNILNKFQKRLNRDAESTAKNVHLEEYPLESEFKQFLDFSKTMEADHDNVAGKPREYVATEKLWKAYQQAFGNAAVDKRTTEYRMARIKPDEFPDDFIVVPDEHNINKKESFVNRLNEKLLKKIYMPLIPNELADASDSISAHHNDLQAWDELHNTSEPANKPTPRHIEKDNDFSWETER